MDVAEWILVIFLSCALLTFLIVSIILVVKLMRVADEARKIIETGQGIAAKADDIVDNVKGLTSVGGIVRTFANRVISEQERRYAEEDAAHEAAEAAVRQTAQKASATEATAKKSPHKKQK